MIITWLKTGLKKRLKAFSVPPVQRTVSEQQQVDQQTAQMALYYFATCPYCVRVRRIIKRLQLNIVLHDIHADPVHRRELINGGGRSMVPCLRIEDENGSVQWLYESADIGHFLTVRFGQQ